MQHKSWLHTPWTRGRQIQRTPQTQCKICYCCMVIYVCHISYPQYQQNLHHSQKKASRLGFNSPARQIGLMIVDKMFSSAKSSICLLALIEEINDTKLQTGFKPSLSEKKSSEVIEKMEATYHHPHIKLLQQLHQQVSFARNKVSQL